MNTVHVFDTHDLPGIPERAYWLILKADGANHHDRVYYRATGNDGAE